MYKVIIYYYGREKKEIEVKNQLEANRLYDVNIGHESVADVKIQKTTID